MALYEDDFEVDEDADDRDGGRGVGRPDDGYADGDGGQERDGGGGDDDGRWEESWRSLEAEETLNELLEEQRTAEERRQRLRTDCLSRLPEAMFARLHDADADRCVPSNTTAVCVVGGAEAEAVSI